MNVILFNEKHGTSATIKKLDRNNYPGKIYELDATTFKNLINKLCGIKRCCQEVKNECFELIKEESAEWNKYHLIMKVSSKKYNEWRNARWKERFCNDE